MMCLEVVVVINEGILVINFNKCEWCEFRVFERYKQNIKESGIRGCVVEGRRE